MPRRTPGTDNRALRPVALDALVFSLTALLVACGCAPAPRSVARTAASEARYFGDVTPPERDVLRFNLGAEPEIYDPTFAVGQPDGRVCRILFEGLTREEGAAGKDYLTLMEENLKNLRVALECR